MVNEHETQVFLWASDTGQDYFYSYFNLYCSAYSALSAAQKKVSENFQNDFSQREFYSSQAGSERIAYINDNTDALLYRLQMIEQAEQEIILSTFDFNADKGGKDVMAALMSAADRGVKVRVIIDASAVFWM